MEHGPSPGSHPANSPTVLVVDDDILLRLTIAGVLREQACNVVEATSADEALSILQSGAAVNVVFTDVRMPGSIDGIALACIIRADWPSVDVVLTSGTPSADDRIGTIRFFSKPYDPDEVAAHIRSLIGARLSSPATRAISA
jgi:CheY-like chemotaxis protein